MRAATDVDRAARRACLADARGSGAQTYTGARSRRWTDEACWRALRSVSRELGEIPSVCGYERHAAHRHDLPSPATIRNRLGRWSSIVTRLAAEHELTALHEQYANQSP